MLLSTAFLVPIIFVTMIAATGLAPAGRRQALRQGGAVLAPLAVLPAILAAVFGPMERLELSWLLFGSVFLVDELARPLLLIAGLLYGAALVTIAWVKLRDAEQATGALSAFLLASFVGNIGTYLAADVMSFYLSFTIMSFSAAGLVIHYRTKTARRATGIYLVMSVLSETALLAGLLLVVAGGATMVADAPQAVAQSGHTMLIGVLLLFGFGIKAGTVPLHVWLPLAHPAAPPAASAVLSGAMVKAGMVGWLRFLPLGEPGSGVGLGWLLLALSLLGAFLAVVFGVLQKDPKVVLAYSTISQMGFIGAVIAVGLLNPDMAGATAAAAVLYAVHHGLAKGALFLGVPVVKHYGRGITGVLVAVGMLGAALAVAGAPLTSGGFGKYVSKEAVEGIFVLGVGLDKVLPFVATGSTLLLLRFGWVIWHAGREPRRQPDGELISWLLTCLAGVAVPWLIGQYWSPLGLPEWSAGVVWDAVWPILLGLGLSLPFWWLALRGDLPGWLPRADGTSVPPGDLVVAEESLWNRGFVRGGQTLQKAHGTSDRIAVSWSDAWENSAAWLSRFIAQCQRKLSGWQASGLAITLILGVAMALVLTYGWWNR